MTISMDGSAAAEARCAALAVLAAADVGEMPAAFDGLPGMPALETLRPPPPIWPRAMTRPTSGAVVRIVNGAALDL